MKNISARIITAVSKKHNNAIITGGFAMGIILAVKFRLQHNSIWTGEARNTIESWIL
jgi:hypothetical protein